MKTFPRLFKKTNTGAIQQWEISVTNSTMTTTHGQVDGKLQTTSDTITEGKNVGRSNETTPNQQAEAEAEARHVKQLKKGYVTSIEAAQAGEVDVSIEGGISPMLAPSKIYPIFAKKLTFPVYVQAKLDGTRCIGIIDDGVCTLWSRTRKRITSMPHIEAALEDLFPNGHHVTDGELYNHDLKNDFEDLISMIRQSEPGEGHEKVQYHIYDFPCPIMPLMNFSTRSGTLAACFLDNKNPSLILVETKSAKNHEEIMALHELNLAAGYEGSMVRNNGPYEHGRRSYHLQKLKNFVDGEFKVIGAEEGRGKDAGTVGAFVCLTPEGKEFKARLKATYERRRELFNNPKEWTDKFLTVAYQNLTSDGIPRFPIGKGFRND